MAKNKLPVQKLTSSKKTKPIPVKIVSDAPINKYVDEDKEWRARDDMRALQRAKEIENDKARMQAVKAVAQKEMNNLKRIC
jgi:hypothetical protein